MSPYEKPEVKRIPAMEAVKLLMDKLEELEKGIKVLRDILIRWEWHEQGGHLGYKGNGQWDFVSSGLGQVTPDELNALFKLAGIEPKVIKPNGTCSDCAHSINGQEKGYRPPCLSCARPKMTNFVAQEFLPSRKRVR